MSCDISAHLHQDHGEFFDFVGVFVTNWAVCIKKVLAMAESRGSLLAKSVQKHAGRAKEKVSDLFTFLGYVFKCLNAFERTLFRSNLIQGLKIPFSLTTVL